MQHNSGVGKTLNRLWRGVKVGRFSRTNVWANYCTRYFIQARLKQNFLSTLRSINPRDHAGKGGARDLTLDIFSLVLFSSWSRNFFCARQALRLFNLFTNQFGLDHPRFCSHQVTKDFGSDQLRFHLRPPELVGPQWDFSLMNMHRFKFQTSKMRAMREASLRSATAMLWYLRIPSRQAGKSSGVLFTAFRFVSGVRWHQGVNRTGTKSIVNSVSIVLCEWRVDR